MVWNLVPIFVVSPPSNPSDCHWVCSCWVWFGPRVASGAHRTLQVGWTQMPDLLNCLQCLVIQFLQHFPTQPSWRVKSKHSFVVLSCGPGVFSDQTVCGRPVRVPDPYLLLYWPCWWIIHQHHVAPWIQTTFHLRLLESAGNILDKVCNYGFLFWMYLGMIECCHCKPLVAAHIEAFELFCVIKDISALLPTYLATYLPAYYF